jgi:hypothetical protein
MMPTTSEREIKRQQNERRERNRAAQARYRERHATTLVEARKMAALLARRKWHAADMARLADMLRGFLGEPGVKALVRELHRQPVQADAPNRSPKELFEFRHRRSAREGKR